ncbi:MAG: flippase-like domain-containing protein [Tannerellaceae bacterium]|nr:flippase-like domain-containing protein [Tannerellaceae bacterium]
MRFKKILNPIIKVFLPLILGCLLLWFLYRNMDFSEIWQVIREGVRYDILLLSLLFGLVANVIRAYRWGLLIKTLGERFRMRNLVYAVLGNYAINFVLPRVGEVWRCGIITKYEKISFPKLLGTLVIDRMTDTISVGLLTLFIFFFNFNFFKRFLANNPELMIEFPDDSGAIWIIVVLLILVAAVWFTFTHLNHLSLVQKAKGLLTNVWEGMKSLWLMERKGLFALQTLLIWSCYFFFFYITFYAFDFTRDLGLSAGLIAFTMGSIGVAVPIQGGIGPWHFMTIASLMCFGVKETDAAVFALVVHAVQSIWTALCGLCGIIALPIVNKE